MTHILGLSGKSGSGKSTLANFLLKNQRELLRKGEVKVYSPADLCKRYLVEQFGIPEEVIYKDKSLLTHLRVRDWHHDGCFSGREILRWWYDLVYGLDPNAPIGAVLRKVKEDGPRLAVVESVRSPEEVGGIKGEGGKVVRLVGRSRDGEGNDPHASETDLDSHVDWDLVLDTGTKTETVTKSELVWALQKWGWLS